MCLFKYCVSQSFLEEQESEAKSPRKEFSDRNSLDYNINIRFFQGMLGIE